MLDRKEMTTADDFETVFLFVNEIRQSFKDENILVRLGCHRLNEFHLSIGTNNGGIVHHNDRSFTLEEIRRAADPGSLIQYFVDKTIHMFENEPGKHLGGFSILDEETGD